MSTIDSYEICKDSLHDLQIESLLNASDLIFESKALYALDHYPRSCFLGIAATEEIGKAYISYTGRGRNLSDPAVTKTIKKQLGNHGNKISCAFYGSLTIAANSEGSLSESQINTSIELMIDLEKNREKSLYVDIDKAKVVQTPTEIITKGTSKLCIEIATMCLDGMEAYTNSKPPNKTTRFNDKIYCMKSSDYSEMMKSSEDYWRYFIDSIGKGISHDEATVTYYEKYWKKSKLFSDSK